MNRMVVLESIVGAIVLAVAAYFLLFAYNVTGKDFGREAYPLGAVFGKADGVTIGSEVRIAGVKIGAVSSNTLDTNTYEARLAMDISNSIPIPEDSIAKIVSDGLLGGAHISIEPGASEIMLESGETITITQGSVDLLGIAMKAFTSNAGKTPGDNATNDPVDDPLGELNE